MLKSDAIDLQMKIQMVMKDFYEIPVEEQNRYFDVSEKLGSEDAAIQKFLPWGFQEDGNDIVTLDGKRFISCSEAARLEAAKYIVENFLIPDYNALKMEGVI